MPQQAQVDLTIGVHLKCKNWDDKMDSGAVVTAVEELLQGAMVFVGPQRKPFTVESVDDPIHVHMAVM